MLRKRSRTERYEHISKRLEHIKDEDFPSFLSSEITDQSWSKTQVVTIEDTKIFVKRIPLTQKEFEQSFSTKNIYNLPCSFNYGMASAGVNPYRELAMHIKTTDWVLNGEKENFLLLYHYRILPCPDQEKPIEATHSKYAEKWNDDPNIYQYILDKEQTTYELVLCLEYIPDNAKQWLAKHSSQTTFLINHMFDIIEFLDQKGIIHFDTHLENILTDGQTFYLTDFGLAMDQNFDLSKEENIFLRENTNYDYACFLFSLYYSVILIKSKEMDLRKLVPYGITSDTNPVKCSIIILKNFESVLEENFVEFDQPFIDMVLKYRKIILLQAKFSYRMIKNNEKNTLFKTMKLNKHLKRLSIVS